MSDEEDYSAKKRKGQKGLMQYEDDDDIGENEYST